MCAEVGLSNGTTPGSLVARVTALEDAPPGSGDGDVVGPASSTDNAIATFDLTTGKIIQDSGVDIGAIAAAQADATQALADAAQGIADAAAARSRRRRRPRRCDRRAVGAPHHHQRKHHRERPRQAPARRGVERLGHHADVRRRRARDARVHGGALATPSGTDPGGAVIFAGASGTHNFAGATRLSSSQSMIRMVLAAIDGTTRYWQCEREAAHLYIRSRPRTASTKTLATYESGRHQTLDTSSNSIAISIPDTLRAGFVWTGRKSSASNSVTFATGSGLITPTFYGSSTITANGALICVFVESSSVAVVSVTVPA